MSDAKTLEAIELASEQSVQSIPRGDGITQSVFAVQWLANAGGIVSPWWSTTRDLQLRHFWKDCDHLSGTIYSMQSKMTAIPVRVDPKDMSDRRAVEEARFLTEVINDAPGFGKGWVTEYGKWIEDIYTQDNGAFLEVIGAGRKDGPIIGMPVSIAHLDSSRCLRTGSFEYPVIYTDTDGQRYKLHYTRVMMASQMESPIADMLGVGVCAISRCINVAQTLTDLLIFKMENLGSRPHRQIVVTRGGLDPRDLQTAFRMAEGQMDAMGLRRYSKVVVAGSQALPEASLESYDLSKMPTGVDETTSITLGMAAIALAFGTDARELFPALTAGATRADALLQHMKQRGKGPGQILQITERLMNFKFVPPHLKFSTDFQDDAQDRQEAEIAMVRANRRVQDTTTGAITDRVMHEQMMEDGDITQAQFDQMELESGRLVNGDESTVLFYSKKREYSQYLDLGVENPLDTYQNDAIYMLDAIAEKRMAVMETLANEKDKTKRWIALESQSALNELELLYMQNPIGEDAMSVEPTNNPSGGGKKGGNGEGSQGMPGRPPKPGLKRVPGHGYVDPRQRKIDLTSPSPTEFNTGTSED